MNYPIVSIALGQEKFCLEQHGNHTIQNKTYWPHRTLEVNQIGNCTLKQAGVKYDVRYTPMNSLYSIGLKEIYKQNNILQYLEKNKTKSDYFKKGNPQLNLWIRRNFKWEYYCHKQNYKRENALEMFEWIRKIKIYANIILMVSVFQMFINSFCFFVIFIPYCKAQMPRFIQKHHSGNRKVLQQHLVDEVRNGNLFLNTSVRNFINLSFGITQITFLTFALHHNGKLINNIRSMDILACSDPIVNKSISYTAHAMKGLQNNQVYSYSLVSFNIFIMYLGPKMCNTNTYYKIWRCVCKYKRACCKLKVFKGGSQ